MAKKIVVDGREFASLKEACDYFDVEYQTAHWRLSRGMSSEEVFSKGDLRKPMIKYKGELYNSIKEVCLVYGLDSRALENKMSEGWETLEEVLDDMIKDKEFSFLKNLVNRDLESTYRLFEKESKVMKEYLQRRFDEEMVERDILIRDAKKAAKILGATDFWLNEKDRQITYYYSRDNVKGLLDEVVIRMCSLDDLGTVISEKKVPKMNGVTNIGLERVGSRLRGLIINENSRSYAYGFLPDDEYVEWVLKVEDKTAFLERMQPRLGALLPNCWLASYSYSFDNSDAIYEISSIDSFYPLVTDRNYTMVVIKVDEGFILLQMYKDEGSVLSMHSTFLGQIEGANSINCCMLGEDSGSYSITATNLQGESLESIDFEILGYKEVRVLTGFKDGEPVGTSFNKKRLGK